MRIAKVSQGTVLLIRLIIRLLLYNQSAECLLALRLLGAEINVGTYLSCASSYPARRTKTDFVFGTPCAVGDLCAHDIRKTYGVI